MTELFEKSRSTIPDYLKSILTDGELEEKMVCRDFRQTTQHGAMEDSSSTSALNYIKNLMMNQSLV